MSRVFVAEERSLGRRVAVKVLPPEMAGQVSIDRFKREIALAARLQHPHVVPLLSAGAFDGLPYFIMPFVEGESLRAQLARGGELPIADGVRILREVAMADRRSQELRRCRFIPTNAGALGSGHRSCTTTLLTAQTPRSQLREKDT